MSPTMCASIMVYVGAAAIFALLLTNPYGTVASGEKFLPSFRNYNGNTPKNGSSAAATAGWLPWGDTAVYAYGLSVAELKTSPNDGSVVECKLTELQDPIECDTLVKKIGRPVVNVCFHRMMEIIAACRALVQTTKGPSLPLNVHQFLFWNQVWNGIFPGTKWCGSGDMAGGYHDLGADVALDRCCRAHDHCPVKLKAFRRGHGLVNFSLYTKSHCACDNDFRNCLMDSQSHSASAIGNMYFNVLRVPCLQEVDESRSFCKSESGVVSKECLNEDQRTVQMKFISAGGFPLSGLNVQSTIVSTSTKGGSDLANEDSRQV
ncbi:uncharacterized protein LOC111265270 [Varroa jacobsoni]|uniref:uncharacterized protein LOC111265270 n=1 Tax=Varroa jacobsoni TaxID=62625 RepID=UPI000BF2FE41|nr:uncharacterized protein LOC111265270 [Varroa jacobsoni]XP_022697533.1 uncharacterized protein LOC111265270 [Varroa jacobsoni]XP_022697534.1 uncharacterized protein LOC111265270 [Varroa jacobsoni]XP_022697535.1 uncharacterized protein LOC111265270 [Varroa jacobsoni]XP_022697536.1 uncharacterized protein LOC111265270 [Varroa jacobsoni]XP_022697537.1 uncharacterized protein LOC111265270 [Varroa jacobsoni]XP_022697540.1 uncharacterized protein LOC111265270 [Varroa jacobsoni]